MLGETAIAFPQPRGAPVLHHWARTGEAQAVDTSIPNGDLAGLYSAEGLAPLCRLDEKAAGSWLCVESAAEARMPLADAPGRGQQLEEDPRFVGETAPAEHNI